MNITITRGGKNYEFKYTTENTGNTLDSNDARTMLLCKWTCDELSTKEEPCEVFFGDYENTTENLEKIQKSARAATEKLPQVMALPQEEETEDNSPKTTENADLPN